jgi:hypothetical protein
MKTLKIFFEAGSKKADPQGFSILEPYGFLLQRNSCARFSIQHMSKENL